MSLSDVVQASLTARAPGDWVQIHIATPPSSDEILVSTNLQQNRRFLAKNSYRCSEYTNNYEPKWYLRDYKEYLCMDEVYWWQNLPF